MPLRKLDDLLVPEVVELVPEHVRFLACALHWAPQVWRSEAAVREHMQLRAHKEGFVRTVLQMLRAQDAFIQQYLRGELEAPARAAAPRLMQSYFDDPESELRLSPEQRRAADNVDQRVDQALRIREVTDDQELDRLLGLVEEHGSMVAVLGEPGTGKTAVVDRCARRAQRLGARILIALPTGVQRSRMKQRHPDVDLDTCHGAFLFHRPLVEAMGIMLCYDLIFVDEAAQLFEEHFGRLDEMWRAAGKVPCVVFAGDDWQLPPPDRAKQNLVHHPKWRLVYKVELHKVWRQGAGDPLLDKLAYLRKNRPMGAEGDAFIRDLCRGHKAWSGHHEPSNLDVQDLLEKRPGTTVITCTRCGAALINGLAVEVLFDLPGKPKLGRIPADYESNPENFGPAGGLRTDRRPEPLPLELYEGLRVRLTKNVNKK